MTVQSSHWLPAVLQSAQTVTSQTQHLHAAPTPGRMARPAKTNERERELMMTDGEPPLFSPAFLPSCSTTAQQDFRWKAALHSISAPRRTPFWLHTPAPLPASCRGSSRRVRNLPEKHRFLLRVSRALRRSTLSSGAEFSFCDGVNILAPAPLPSHPLKHSGGQICANRVVREFPTGGVMFRMSRLDRPYRCRPKPIC